MSDNTSRITAFLSRVEGAFGFRFACELHCALRDGDARRSRRMLRQALGAGVRFA